MRLPEARRVPYRSAIPPMLRMRDVKKSYRTPLGEVAGLSGCSLSVAAGELVAVLGPPGSGKSTLLQVAGLMTDFDDGEYTIDGDSAVGLDEDARAMRRADTIGFVRAGFHLISDRAVLANVEAPLHARGMVAEERRERAERALARVGLSPSAGSALPAQLGYAQRARVAIARALVNAPRLLLADEPTLQLDATDAREIVELFAQLNAGGTTIVAVTHDVELVARATRRLHMQAGRIVDGLRAAGAPAWRSSPGWR